MPTARRHFRSTLHRFRKWLLSLGLVVILAACLAGAILFTLTRQAPAWWRTTNPEDPQTVIAGEEVENGVLNLIYAARHEAGEPWMVTLRASDANAWLATRLRPWLANADAEFDWPEEIQDLQVEFDEDHVQVGARLEGADRVQIVSASLRPWIGEEGALWVEAEQVTIGRLPIPADWVLRHADPPAGDLLSPRMLEIPETGHLLDAFRGICSLMEDPVIDLGDGRRVRLLRLAAHRGRLIVECRTEFVE